MKFERLYEAVKFADLPLTMDGFYGFWISPSGEVDLVRGRHDHATKAKWMILGNPFLKQRFIEVYQLGHFEDVDAKLEEVYYMSFKDFLYETMKYMRVMRDTHNNTLYASCAKPPPPKQKSAFEDLAMLYDMNHHLEVED